MKGFVKEISLQLGEKAEAVIDGESKESDCDEVICSAGWVRVNRMRLTE